MVGHTASEIRRNQLVKIDQDFLLHVEALLAEWHATAGIDYRNDKQRVIEFPEHHLRQPLEGADADDQAKLMQWAKDNVRFGTYDQYFTTLCMYLEDLGYYVEFNPERYRTPKSLIVRIDVRPRTCRFR